MEQSSNTHTNESQQNNKQARASKLMSGARVIYRLTRGFMKFTFYLVGILFGISLLTSLVGLFEDTTNSAIVGSSSTKIVMIDASGLLIDSTSTGLTGFNTGELSPVQLVSMLEDIRYDPHVKAIILRINSPGGTSTAAEEMYQTLTSFKAETGIPIVVSMSEVAASGGYYISLAADYIFANNSTITGSIGVVSSVLNYQELANEYGVKAVTVSTGENKDFLNPLTTVSEEQTTILSNMLGDAFKDFKERVLSERDLVEKDIEMYFDGRPVTGAEAARVNLIDETGTLDDVISYTRNIVGDTDAQIVKVGSASFIEYLFSTISRTLPFSQTSEKINTLFSMTGKPLYLYSP